MSEQPKQEQSKIFEKAIDDQIRRYVVRVVIPGDHGTIESFEEVASFDNYQLEGEMNMDEEIAISKLQESGYTRDEALSYLGTLPTRVINENVHVSKDQYDYFKRSGLIDAMVREKITGIGIKPNGKWS